MSSATSTSPGFAIWNKQDPTKFLQSDRQNPARKLAAQLIQQELPRIRRRGSVTLLEIGPGPGFDYEDHFQHMTRLHYSALEGSESMLLSCQRRFPGVGFARGDFASLAASGEKYDITYAKAVFEHQAALEQPLQAMLAATRHLAVINWYLPPGPEAVLRYNREQDVHSNRYSAAEVARIITQNGFKPEIRTAPSPGNALYLCRRS